MSSQISRKSGSILGTDTGGEELALTTSASTTPAIRFSEFAGGSIRIPTGSSITTLTFHGACKFDGTYVALYDVDNAAVTMTVAAARIYPLPDECFGLAGIKIVADAAGAVDVFLKG